MGKRLKKSYNLKDGYYFEIGSGQQASGIKIYRSTKREFLTALKKYKGIKNVKILGKIKNGKVEEVPEPKDI